MSKKFILKEHDEKQILTYVKESKSSCYEINPVIPIKLDDMIDIQNLVIISPDLIYSLINKKVKKNLEKILKLLAIIYDDDDADDDSILNLALDEIEKFRRKIAEKYQEHLEAKEHKLLLKKLEILQSEINLRKETTLGYYQMLKGEKQKRKKEEVKQVDIIDMEPSSKTR